MAARDEYCSSDESDSDDEPELQGGASESILGKRTAGQAGAAV